MFDTGVADPHASMARLPHSLEDIGFITSARRAADVTMLRIKSELPQDIGLESHIGAEGCFAFLEGACLVAKFTHSEERFEALPVLLKPERWLSFEPWCDGATEKRCLGPGLKGFVVMGKPVGGDEYIVVRPDDVLARRVLNRTVPSVGVSGLVFDQWNQGQSVLELRDHGLSLVGAGVIDQKQLPRLVRRHRQLSQSQQGLLQQPATIPRTDSHTDQEATFSENVSAAV